MSARFRARSAASVCTKDSCSRWSPSSRTRRPMCERMQTGGPCGPPGVCGRPVRAYVRGDARCADRSDVNTTPCCRREPLRCASFAVSCVVKGDAKACVSSPERGAGVASCAQRPCATPKTRNAQGWRLLRVNGFKVSCVSDWVDARALDQKGIGKSPPLLGGWQVFGPPRPGMGIGKRSPSGELSMHTSP